MSKIHWYQWILDIRPILYYLDSSLPGYTTRFGAFLNPVVCWGGLLAMIAVAVRMVQRRCGKALFILVGYLSQLAPWFLIGRITFAYHYFPSVIFLILALCYVFHDLAEREDAVRWKPAVYADRRRRGPLCHVLSRTGGHYGTHMVYHLLPALVPFLALLRLWGLAHFFLEVSHPCFLRIIIRTASSLRTETCPWPGWRMPPWRRVWPARRYTTPTRGRRICPRPGGG